MCDGDWKSGTWAEWEEAWIISVSPMRTQNLKDSYTYISSIVSSQDVVAWKILYSLGFSEENKLDLWTENWKTMIIH